MTFIGWIKYEHESMPPKGIIRDRYYKIFNEGKDYIIIGDNEIQLKFKRELIEEIFVPSNGYSSWEEIFKPKESKKVNQK